MKESVSFCDQVILLATNDDDGDDCFIPGAGQPGGKNERGGYINCDLITAADVMTEEVGGFLTGTIRIGQGRRNFRDGRNDGNRIELRPVQIQWGNNDRNRGGQ